MLFHVFLGLVPLLKPLTIAVLLATLASGYRLYGLGVALADSRKGGREYEPELLARHPRMLRWVGGFAIIAVVLIETQVRLSSYPYAGNLPLLVVHLCLIVLMLAVIAVVMMRFRGNTHPRVHRVLVRVILVLFLFVLGTGIFLLAGLWSR